MITERSKPLALQAILYFTLAKAAGKSQSEAVAEFVGSDLCKEFDGGEAACRVESNCRLTVANVYGLAAAAGYAD